MLLFKKFPFPPDFCGNFEDFIPLEFPENHFSPIAYTLLNRMLKIEPEERPSADEILEMATPWFDEFYGNRQKPILERKLINQLDEVAEKYDEFSPGM